ncbi:MAG: hypothetical protein ACLGIE_00810 [Alphaproteobacteria bacterium]
MATSPANPQQAGGSGTSPQQQQGGSAPQQVGQPIFRDWASI